LGAFFSFLEEDNHFLIGKESSEALLVMAAAEKDRLHLVKRNQARKIARNNRILSIVTESGPWQFV